MTIFGLVIGSTALAAAGGLVAGWILLPQPRFVTWIAEKLGIKDRA